MDIPRHHRLSRRGFCLCCISATTFTATGGWLTPGEVFAQARGIVDMIKEDAATSPINVHHIRGNIAVLEGSGGNVAVQIGRHGKVLVDAGIAVSRPQLQTALAELGSGPVTHLINTHWHFDHADGNSWLHSLGPKITSHEKTRDHLSVSQIVADWDYTFKPLADAALPTDLFSSRHSLETNDSRIDLEYYGPAHTDSDISVRFVQPDVVHVGDTYWNGIYPFIDYSTGGSIDGSIKAAATNLKNTNDKTIVIPGHGHPISNRAGLKEFHDMLVGIRTNVAGLKKQGKSLEDIIAAKPTAAYDAKWGKFVITPALFTKLVHMGV